MSAPAPCLGRCGRVTPKRSGLCSARCRARVEAERPADLAAALIARAERHEALADARDTEGKNGGAERLREHAHRWRQEAASLTDDRSSDG